MLVCEDSLCPKKLPDVSGPDLGEAGCYRMVSEPTLAVSRARTGVSARVKASRPLILVLVINDNGLWINDFN